MLWTFITPSSESFRNIAKSSAATPEAVTENLERISGFVKSAANNMSQLVWTMNPANDTLENFAAEIWNQRPLVSDPRERAVVSAAHGDHRHDACGAVSEVVMAAGRMID